MSDQAPPTGDPRPRWNLYVLLTLIAVAILVGRIGSIGTGTIGANDRSRWLTVRALVDNGTYEIGRRSIAADGRFKDEGIMTERGWDTIDKVLKPDNNVFYSSKPPLLATMTAGVYWIVKSTMGLTIVHDQLAVIRIVLIFVNVVPFVLYCLMLGLMADRFGQCAWARIYMVAAGCFATFVSTFSDVLNNHTPAAVAALAAVYFATAPCEKERRSPGANFLAGFFAGLAAALELPAASLAAWCVGWTIWRAGVRAGAAALLGAAIPAAAWLITNYLAIGRLEPAYAHVGGEWYKYEGSAWATGHGLSGIERAGELETKADYALNLTFGHHGLFSLMPVLILWIFAFVSMPRASRGGRSEETPGSREIVAAELFPLIWSLSLVAMITITFYVMRTSNYGGANIGPRWLFWLIPLLLVMSLPAVDDLAQTRSGRILACCLLFTSAASVIYSADRPWNPSWFYVLMTYVDPSATYR